MVSNKHFTVVTKQIQNITLPTFIIGCGIEKNKLFSQKNKICKLSRRVYGLVFYRPLRYKRN